MTHYPHHRSSPRTFVVLPITIKPERGEPHIGVVRDLSKEAIFFFTHFKPRLHSKLSFTLQIAGSSIPGAGEVIRVQQAAPGVAVGVALSLQDSPAIPDALIEEGRASI